MERAAGDPTLAHVATDRREVAAIQLGELLPCATAHDVLVHVLILVIADRQEEALPCLLELAVVPTQLADL